MKLIVEEDGTRSIVPLDRPILRVGRAVDNEVRLASAKVSRHHCRLELADGGVSVFDLGSANGLVVNGRRTRQAVLHAGDALELGGARIVLEPDEEEVPAEAEDGLGLRTLTGDAEGERSRVHAFARVTRLLVEETELPALLRTLVDAAIELVDAERGFLLLASGDERSADGETRMDVRVARSFDRSDIPVPSSRLSMGIAALALESGKAVLSVDAGRDERFSAMASVEGLRLRSVLCVPVRLGGRPAGVLYVDNRLQQGVFDHEHQELALLLADQAALAIRNARLLQQLLERNRRLAESNAQVEALAEQLGRKVRDRDEQLAVVRAELGRERGRYDYGNIVATSDGMRRVFERLDKVVECDLPVLIHGESGTGKELIARAIHVNGARKDEPFISENCAALPDSLLESELFGHARGAFTGADRAKKGLIEQASGGTLFLDEIGDMSPEMQKKLLRVLQEGEVRPLGSSERVQVDVRFVSASHRDLDELVREGGFREDLYYRIKVLELRLPPLRERREDVPLLARELLARAARELGRKAPYLPHEVVAALTAHDWPGNVRELENELRRLVVLADESVRLDQLSPAVLSSSGLSGVDDEADAPRVDGSLRQAVADFERRALRGALVRCEGNKSRAAKELGISRFALQRKLDKYHLSDLGEPLPDAPEDADGDDEDGE